MKRRNIILVFLCGAFLFCASRAFAFSFDFLYFLFPKQLITVTKTGDGSQKGLVVSNLSGIDCGLDCTEKYGYGKEIVFTASIDGEAGSFLGWSGACSGNEPICAVKSDKAKTVIAEFSIKKFFVEIEKTGFGVVESSPAGINCGSSCKVEFNYEDKVVFYAKPSQGSTFSGWSGACEGKEETCSLEIKENKEIGVGFKMNPGTIPLIVSKSGLGSGNVVSRPSGINCGSSCEASFDPGTQITLNANALGGSTFSGWSGACAGTSRSCVMTLNSSKRVNAVFEAEKHTVKIITVGQGVISSSPSGVSCSGNACSGVFESGTRVILTANPSKGSGFVGWTSGPCSKEEKTCELVVQKDIEQTAVFGTDIFSLLVRREGEGTITSDLSGIDCGTDCGQSYPYKTEVILTAFPQEGYSFSGWSGDCSGMGECKVLLIRDLEVEAKFSLKRPVLKIVSLEGGNVNSNPSGISCGSDCLEEYDYKTVVSILAKPIPGYYFSGWSGDCSGRERCLLEMKEDKNVTANFSKYKMTVGLKANPSSGFNPLETEITASVSSDIPETANYTFWWDCSYSGTSLEEAIEICQEPVAKFDGTSESNITISHSYQEKKSYFAKVIVEKGPFSLEKRLEINAIGHLPSADSFKVVQPDYCSVGPAASFVWRFVDPQEKDSQFAYRVQVDNSSNFISPEIDSLKKETSSQSYGSDRGLLSYNTSYYWRVKLWDEINKDESSWINTPLKFTTPSHKYPLVDFSWQPVNPGLEEEIVFNDQSIVYGGSSKQKIEWIFEDGRPETSFSSAPRVRYFSPGNKKVTLRITDSSGFSCSLTKTIEVKLSFPEL